MQKTIIDENFHSFINDVIVTLPTYRKASKQMSFSFRWEKEEHIFAYASLMHCDNVCEGVGCRILDFKNENPLADEKFFDRIVSVAEMWATRGKHMFDYLWFYQKDLTHQQISQLLESIDGFYRDEKHKAYIRKNTSE